MIQFLEQKLSNFKQCFQRNATYEWFVIIVMGFFTRTDKLGVTSFIRSLMLQEKHYEKILHFFRSSAYSISDLRKTWINVLKDSGLLQMFDNRILLFGDGTKLSKEGRFMPGVKKLYQESENSAKASFIYGHMYGAISVLGGNEDHSLSFPIYMEIQDGLAATAKWDEENEFRDSSHVTRTIELAYEAAEILGCAYIALDRYFLTTPALNKLKELNANSHRLDIITRAKMNCVGYTDPPERTPHQRGRSRVRGEAVHLKQLFSERENDFTTTTVTMYGKEETVSYLKLDLLWGKKVYQKLRFVLVKSRLGDGIFVSTDLEMKPERIIEAYSHRFKIESVFREFKQQFGGFCYHFWSALTPKLNRYKRKTDPDALSEVDDEKSREQILKTIQATESFVCVSCIAMGLCQMISLTPEYAKTISRCRYLRTKSDTKVSEATVLDYFRKYFFSLLLKAPDSTISRLIRSRMKDDSEEEDLPKVG